MGGLQRLCLAEGLRHLEAATPCPNGVAKHIQGSHQSVIVKPGGWATISLVAQLNAWNKTSMSDNMVSYFRRMSFSCRRSAELYKSEIQTINIVLTISRCLVDGQV
jgi:hypothetical protein